MANPYVPVPGTIMLCFDFQMAQQLWQFCIGFRKLSGSIASADLSATASIGANWIGGQFMPQSVGDNECRQVRSTNLEVQGGEEAVVASGIFGSLPGPAAPIHAAYVASFRTQLRGRSYRGRAYASGIPTDHLLDSTHLTSAYANQLALAFQRLQTDMNTGGFQQVVISRFANGAQRLTAVTTPVTHMISTNVINAQRRRLFGRGT